MASKIWRLNTVATRGEGDLELSELQLHDVSGRIDQSAVITCSHAPIAGSLADLADGLASSTVRFAAGDVQAPGFFIRWEFPSPVDVAKVRFGSTDSQSGFVGRFSLDCLVGAVWTRAINSWWVDWPGVRSMQTFDFGVVIDGPDVVAAAYFGMGGSPASFVDLVGNAWVFTASAAIGKAAGRSNNVLLLTGGTVATENRSLFHFGAADFTVDVWVRPSATIGSNQYGGWVCSNDSTGGTRAFALIIGTNRSVSINFYSSNSINNEVASPAGAIAWDTWSHLEIGRSGNTFYLFVNGVLVATKIMSVTLQTNTAGNPTLGSNPGGQGGTFFLGAMDAFRVLKGRCRHTTAFTPPDIQLASNMPVSVRAVSAGTFVEGAAMPQPSVFAVQKTGIFRDMEFGGIGRVYGTVARKNTPSNTPMVRRVRLHRSRDGLLVRETWSKADGTYEFRGVAAQYEYDVIAWDHEQSYRSVVANNLAPEV